MPDKIVCQQLPVQPGTYEYKLKLEIVHTAVTMMATIAGTPNDLLELIPTRLVELRPGEPSHRTLQMIRPPTDMAGHGHVAVNVNSTASSARDAELLLAIDAFFVEGSHRCIVRAASGSTQPIAPRQPQVIPREGSCQSLECVGTTILDLNPLGSPPPGSLLTVQSSVPSEPS